MSKLKFDELDERFYETGVDQGVLYTYENGQYQAGVVWNGLTAVNQNPTGAEPNPLYADNIKYLTLMSNEDFGGTIEAYTYPDEFMACDGTATLVQGVKVGQQTRKMFGFCYRTKVGNAEDGVDYGYIIHLVYGCMAKPSSRNYSTINENPEAITFSWEFTTTPIPVDLPEGWDGATFKPTAYLEIDSNKVAEGKLALLEAQLYGTDGSGSTQGTDPTLLLPGEIITLLS